MIDDEIAHTHRDQSTRTSAASRSWRPFGHLSILWAVTLGTLFATLIFVGVAEGYEIFRGSALGPDAGYYLMLAQRIVDGEVPYRDFRVLHPAGVFYQQAGLLALSGGSLNVIEGQFLLYYPVLLLCVLIVARQLFSVQPPGLLAIVALFVWTVPAAEAFYFVIEPIAGMWGWLALALASLCFRRHSSKTTNPTWARGLTGVSRWISPIWLLVGVLLGVATSQKQIAGVFLVPILALGWLAAKNMNRDSRVTVFVSILAGSILPFAIFFVRYPDTIPLFWHQNVVMLVQYAQGSYVPSNTPVAIARQAFLLNWPLWILLFGLLAVRSQQGITDRSCRYVSVAFLLAAVLFLIPSLSRAYPHYLLFPLPFVCLAVGVFVERLMRERALLLSLGMLSVALLPTLSNLWDRRASELRVATGEKSVRSITERITAFVERESGEADRIIIIPDTPQYYFLSGKRAATDNYEFYPDEAVFDAIRTQKFPVFVARHRHRDLRAYESRLTQLGYEPYAREGWMYAWRPSARPLAPPRAHGSD